MKQHTFYFLVHLLRRLQKVALTLVEGVSAVAVATVVVVAVVFIVVVLVVVHSSCGAALILTQRGACLSV